jgi:hypothetical protein
MNFAKNAGTEFPDKKIILLKLDSAGTRKLGNKGIFIILVIIFISSIWKNSITIVLRFKIW